MARRDRKNSPKSLVSAIGDAVDASITISDDSGIAAHGTTHTGDGLPSVFVAAREAVTSQKTGRINHAAFNAAMKAASKAAEDSTLQVNYERMAASILCIPDHAIWMAARQAAGDLFHRLPAKKRERLGERLLEKARKAAVMAARVRLGRDESEEFPEPPRYTGGHTREDESEEFRAAVKSSQKIAGRAIPLVAGVVHLGATVHAATAAVFGAAIRGLPPKKLAGAVERACEDLPEAASRHDEIVSGFVAALSEAIYGDAARRRKANTAVRGVEKLLQNEAATQITKTIYDGAFGAAYGALAACAYATSRKPAFKAGYEAALAEACGVERREPPKITIRDMRGGRDEDMSDAVPDEVLQELYQRLSHTMAQVMGAGEETPRRRRFPAASEVDYEAAASSDDVKGMIALYDAAYRAGARAAKSVIS